MAGARRSIVRAAFAAVCLAVGSLLSSGCGGAGGGPAAVTTQKAVDNAGTPTTEMKVYESK
jgi:hypothetical protein